MESDFGSEFNEALLDVASASDLMDVQAELEELREAMRVQMATREDVDRANSLTSGNLLLLAGRVEHLERLMSSLQRVTSAVAAIRQKQAEMRWRLEAMGVIEDTVDDLQEMRTDFEEMRQQFREGQKRATYQRRQNINSMGAIGFGVLALVAMCFLAIGRETDGSVFGMDSRLYFVIAGASLVAFLEFVVGLLFAKCAMRRTLTQEAGSITEPSRDD